VDELICYTIAIATTAGISLVTLLGLYVFVPALRWRWFPIARLRPGAWTGREVFVAFCIERGFPSFLLALLVQIGFFTPLIGPLPDAEAEQLLYSRQCAYISSPITSTFTLGCLFALMFLSSGTRPNHYGLTWARWPANLGLGVVSFLVAWPIIMGTQKLAVLAFPPTSDPYLALAKLGLSAWEWLLFGFQLIVAAPVLEEILFRGILQGWLRRATLAGQLTLPFVTLFLAASGFAEFDKATDQYIFHYGPLVFAMFLASGYGYWLYRLTRCFGLSDVEIQRWQPLPTEPKGDDERRRRWADANATLAIFGTAMLFAVVHSSNWPAPVALFPMGLALGWLSRRTQSLIGPIVFHAMFNLTSFIALYGLAR
jgi:membrane protease YdiL (CAAX protease family)